MALLGSILKRTIDLNTKIPRLRRKDAMKMQVKTLKKLLSKAEFTAFGEHHNFTRILSESDTVKSFKAAVGVHDYNSMFRKWWYRSLNGEAYVTWPEKVKYFALSSGTSDSSSKHIPVTKDMLRAIRRASRRQLLALAHYNLSPEFFQKGILMVGGSTHLNYNGSYYSGDLSGITTGNLPFWFQHFYKPGRRIARERKWEDKLQEMVMKAKEWDIGVVCGVPAWIQILFERIIKQYNVKTIHDIWPNLEVYVWGGVSIKPYRKSLDKLCGKPIGYLETYLASEGFMAFQNDPTSESQVMQLDNGIFFEFVPFNSDNFDADGNLKPKPSTLTIAEVDEQTEYALLISTCSGAWRYLIGDTVKFTNVDKAEIIITGRTKQFLSLCGEHLSQDNMNRAIDLAAEELNIEINEYTVAGENYENLFAHRWYVGTNAKIDPEVLRKTIDEHLKVLNDDYRVERSAALKEVIVEVLPLDFFSEWMRRNGKVGGQHKFPRVMKNDRLESWRKHIAEMKSGELAH
ncbi:MAG TPA: GH3 auxin-responsive promoter family protein [Bacteroidia bacterium]|nr:GH3 auxin-responsive promoter family protein [Bacteroidia bacterium]